MPRQSLPILKVTFKSGIQDIETAGESMQPREPQLQYTVGVSTVPYTSHCQTVTGMPVPVSM